MDKPDQHPLKIAFMRWQCRLRQMSVRDDAGKPSIGAIAELIPHGEGTDTAKIITVINKSSEYSKLPELQHIAKHTNDPMQRTEKALRLFSEYYYQRPHEFSDTIAAVFATASTKLQSLQKCRLRFAAYGQEYLLPCGVAILTPETYDYQATWWHNYLFNPQLSNRVQILGFTPDWQTTRTNPTI